jgi:hypothetical protein
MKVGIDDEANIATAGSSNSRLDFLAERRELRVDDERAVGSGRQADIPTLTHQHVKIAGNRNRLNLYVRKVVLSERWDADEPGAR